MSEWMQDLGKVWGPAVFVIGQLIFVIIWSVHMDDRMNSQERSQDMQDKRIEQTMKMLSDEKGEMILFGERQRVVIETLATNGKKIDQIVDAISRLPQKP